MDKSLFNAFITWLRTKHLGVFISTREFIAAHMAPFGILPVRAALFAKHIRNGVVTDLGCVGTHVVTGAFVAELVDALQAGGVADFDDYKYHDSGTGTNAEAAADTALQTPCGEARDVGTQIEGATANIYKSVATGTYAGTFAIIEHGLFNASAAGTLMDRTKLATVVNVISGDQIEWTYQITFTAGS